DLGPLVDQVLMQEGHQEIEFRLRPLPVLGTEAVERELPDAEAAAFFDRRANAFYAAAVTFVSWQAALLRPSAVAVHDDGDVPRQPVRVQAGGRDPLQCLGGEHNRSHLGSDTG